MAKPGSSSSSSSSSSSRTLRGTMIFLVLLLASTQAGPVMAFDEQIAELTEKFVTTVLGMTKVWEKPTKVFIKPVAKAGTKIPRLWQAYMQNKPAGGGTATATPYVDTAVIRIFPAGAGTAATHLRLDVFTADITEPAAVRTGGLCTAGVPAVGGLPTIDLFGDRGKVPLLAAGKLLFGATPDCRSPAVAGAAPAAVLGLGRGGSLTSMFPRFSYLVTSDATTFVWLFPPASNPGPQLLGQRTSIPLLSNPNNYPSRYYVDITSMWVGKQPVQAPPELSIIRPDGTGGVYLSTTEPYTYLEKGVYGLIKDILVSQIQGLNPGATPLSRNPAADELCYLRRSGLVLPQIMIVFSSKAAIRLTGSDPIWYRSGPYTICLAIRPALNPGQASVLGSKLQSGTTVTVDLTAPTLTFSKAYY